MMEFGTQEFWKRLEELVAEFGDDSERLSFLFGFRRFLATTKADIHRWPLFDMRKGLASYRAIIGHYKAGSRLMQYVVYYQKRNDPQEKPYPLCIWIAKEEIEETLTR